MRTAVTDHFPQDAWKDLDKPEMIEEPKLDAYVFAKIDEAVTIANESDGDQYFEPGTVLIVRYRRVRELVDEGKVALLS